MTVAAITIAASSAHAQYFGRNKVQYDRFEFSVLPTAHFDLYYYEHEREAVQLAAVMAERWYERLSALFDHRFDRRQVVILYASHGHFMQTAIVDGLREGIGGFTDGAAGRVVMPFAATLAETDHVLGHELVHAFQRDILKRRGRTLAALPLWFAEGMAEQISVGRLDPHTQMWMRDAMAHGGLPSLIQLGQPRWFPYRYGQALWAFLEHRFGTRIYHDALWSRAGGGGIGRLEAVTRLTRTQLTRAWHEWARDNIPVSVPSPPSPAAVVIDAGHRGGRLNVSPALSPDGRYVVFLSERDGIAMDVYLAETASGRVLRRLTSSALDPHFDSLQFLSSAGAWDRSGQRFALATVRNGHPMVTIYGMPGGQVQQTMTVEGVDQVLSPTWSPDGRRLAFSGTAGGLSDLYIHDLQTGATLPLTDDPFSDLQPAWSPTGEQLAFVTDRFTSHVEDVVFGSLQLALIDVESGRVQRLADTSAGKQIDPHWDSTGSGLYFVSDDRGTSQSMWWDLRSATSVPVFDTTASVSGVTALSPALSLSADGRTLAMSVYSRGRFSIRIEPLPTLARAAAAVASQATLPATPSISSESSSASAAAAPLSPRPYTGRLSVLSLGQPYLSAGGGAFGGFLRAGTSIAMSDVLAQHALQAAIQVGRRETDFAVQASYVNRRARLNWGLVGGQVPAMVGLSESRSTRVTSTGETVLARQSDVAHAIHRQLAGVVAYPFHRGLRLEGSAGFDRVTFERETTMSTYASNSGVRIDQERSRRQSEPTTLVEAGAALVYDMSIGGPTGPLMGQRYRLSVSPTMGDVNVVTTGLDYRRYWMPTRPFTIAVRGQHMSRFGTGVDDARLVPLVWTLRDLVRGYDVSEDLLRTRRVSAMNVELRAPIPGAFRRDLGSGPLPLAAFAFADWGRFTTTTTLAADAPGRALWSAGIGARLNAAGFVFEFAAAHAFNVRPGWRLAVNFRPAF